MRRITTYQNYRRAAKQHWDMMKQYYEKAADAFREGNKKEVDYLIQEGKRCYQMARLADEKSAGEIIKSKKAESRNEVCLDLHSQDPANVPNLLRFHLKQLANIPSMDYLNVIIGVDDGSFKMGQRRRKVWFYQIIYWMTISSDFFALYLLLSCMHDSEVNPQGAL